MAKRHSQATHDDMVMFAAEFLLRNRYQEVRADLEGLGRPEQITWKATGEGHVPDVTAEDQNKRLNLFEVETADSIVDQHTTSQWKLFAAWAREHDARFWVVVPKGAVASARGRLLELGIKAQVWGV